MDKDTICLFFRAFIKQQNQRHPFVGFILAVGTLAVVGTAAIVGIVLLVRQAH
jgi:hypothetical protein